jgi:hypothetical protein
LNKFAIAKADAAPYTDRVCGQCCNRVARPVLSDDKPDCDQCRNRRQALIVGERGDWRMICTKHLKMTIGPVGEVVESDLVVSDGLYNPFACGAYNNGRDDR